MAIHAGAFIHPDAKIGANATIGPFAYVDSDVEIGANAEIHPNAVIYSGTRIGKNCRIFPGAVVGGIPQDLKYAGEYTTLEIGDYVTIRECATLNRGTIASGITRIGDHCLLMAYCHIAHDCIIGDRVILANNVNLAGHINIGDYAILGGLVAVHQFVNIGAHAIIGGGSLVRKDIPPYIRAAREPVAYCGVNRIGLQRRNFSESSMDQIKRFYSLLFESDQNISDAVNSIQKNMDISPELNLILDFIEQSTRGLIKGPRLSRTDKG